MFSISMPSDENIANLGKCLIFIIMQRYMFLCSFMLRFFYIWSSKCNSIRLNCPAPETLIVMSHCIFS